MRTSGSIVINDRGQMLLYTVESTHSRCEEKAQEIFCAWDTMKARGARIVPVMILTLDEVPALDKPE
jgi:hypothetical protein